MISAHQKCIQLISVEYFWVILVSSHPEAQSKQICNTAVTIQEMIHPKMKNDDRIFILLTYLKLEDLWALEGPGSLKTWASYAS